MIIVVSLADEIIIVQISAMRDIVLLEMNRSGAFGGRRNRTEPSIVYTVVTLRQSFHRRLVKSWNNATIIAIIWFSLTFFFFFCFFKLMLRCGKMILGCNTSEIQVDLPEIYDLLTWLYNPGNNDITTNIFSNFFRPMDSWNRGRCYDKYEHIEWNHRFLDA